MPRAELFDGTVLEFEDGTPDSVVEKVARQETDRIRTDQARTPLPAGVSPSPTLGGRGAQGGPTAEEMTLALAARRGTMRTASPYAPGDPVPRLAPGQQALPDGIEPSNIQGGRGNVVPYDARVRTADAPFNDKREALDTAVDLIESGAPREDVYAKFEQLGIFRSDIDQRGMVLGGPAFKGAPNAGTARSGATSGTMAGVEPGATEGVANFGRRVAARSGQAFTGVAAQTGLFGTGGLADSLARDQKRLEAAAPGTKVQEQLANLGKVKTYSEIPDALVKNPSGAAMMLFESLAMTAPMMAAPVMGLGAKGMAGIVGASSGGLEFGSALTDALNDRGISLLESAKVAQALSDEKFMAGVRKKGVARGLTIGAIDAMTAGFAGKFLEPALAAVRAGKLTGSAAMRATAGAWASELSVQMAGGAGGERLGQLLTGEDKPLDVVMEALGEGVGAPIEALSNIKEARHAAAQAKYAAAIAAGFNVDPPLTTDRPDVQRNKTLGIFQGLAAKYGIDPEAVDRAVKTAKSLPSDDVGPFLGKLVQALGKRNLIAKPVEEHAADTLTAGPIEPPIDETKLAKGETKPAAAETPAAETDAPAATEDFTGLSEPSTAPTTAAKGGGRYTVSDSIGPDGPAPETVRLIVRPDGSAAIERGDDDALIDVTNMIRAGFSPERAIAQSIGHDTSGKNVTATHAVDQAAHAAAPSPLNELPEPTDAQKEAGNYQKGHVRIAGLDISVENPQGSIRRSKPTSPVKWETEMKHHYGYIRGTVGMDKDHVDAFVNPGTPEDFGGTVFVVDQQFPQSGKPDEHKVMIGFDTMDQARDAYLSNYHPGFKGMRGISAVPMAEFKVWLKEGDTTKPFTQALYGRKQPDLPGTSGQPAAGAAGGRVEPAGSRGDLGREPTSAGRGEQNAPAPAQPSVRSPVVVRDDGGASHPVVANAGRTPTATEPLTLRPNADGTLTPHMGTNPLVDYDSGNPIVLPAGTGLPDAVKAIRAAGAVSKKINFYPTKADDQNQPSGTARTEAQAAPVEAPAPARSDAAPAPVVPAAGPAPVQAAGVEDAGTAGTKPASESVAAAPAAPAPDWLKERIKADVEKAGGKIIGQNEAGQDIREDSRGVRTVGGKTESVRLIPQRGGGHKFETGPRAVEYQTAEERAAATPPAPEPGPRALTDEQAFADDYAAFEDKTVEQQVQVADTGQTATLRMDAAKAMRALDARLKVLRELKTCIGGHA